MNKSDIFIDVRSGSVAVAVAKLGENKKREFSFFERKDIPLQDDFDSAKSIGSVENVCGQLLKRIAHTTDQPNQIYLTIGAPWITSRTQKISYESEKPFTYNEKIAKSLMDKDSANFVEDFEDNESVELIEQSILNIELNGYAIKKPYGKVAKTLGLTVHLSLVGKSVLSSLRHAIQTIFNHQAIHIHSFAYLALLSTDTIRKANSFIMLNIGGEISEVSLIKDGYIKESLSFPLGAHRIFRTLADNLNITPDEARILYNSWLTNQTQTEISKKILQILDDVKLLWLTYLNSILQKLTSSYVLPRGIYIIGSQDLGGLVGAILNDMDCFIMSPDVLNNYYSSVSNAKPDTFVLIEAISIDKFNSLR